MKTFINSRINSFCSLFSPIFTTVSIIVTLYCLSGSTHSLAVEKPSTNNHRAQIGVAFSGGGARGIAHIGVIKAFEELKIPIDYIAGTSMGSIIGGLYASGLSTQALERAVVHEINWNLALNLTDDRDMLSYRERQNQRRFFQLELGWDKKGITASSGFIGEQELFMVLKRLTRNIVIDDFSKLPIPFKTVATDLNTAKPYLLEKGELALALRASMAVPFAFAPVQIDGRVLVDGGLVSNIPVEIVKQMGADIVIAVDITTPLELVNANSSFLTVAKQSMNVSLIQNALVALAKADIVLQPAIKEFSVADFHRASELVTKGYQAVMEKKALFSKLALNNNEYTQYRAAMRAKTPPTYEKITPHFLQFTGNQRTSAITLQRKLKYLLGQQLTFKEIKQAAKQLMSLKDFKKVTYQVIQNSQGETGLLFQLHEKPWGPHYFRLGLNLATSFDDKTDFLMLLRHERLNVNRLSAEWINEIEFGTGFSLYSEFYQPLDYQNHYFLAPYARLERRFVDIFAQQRGVAEYDLESFQIGLNIGINFGKTAELRTGIVYDDTNTALRIGEPSAALQDNHTQQTLFTLNFGYDTLDARSFARQGLKIDIDGNLYDTHLGSDNSYQKARFYTRHHFPLFNQITWISELTFATLFDSHPPEYEDFSLGGFEQLAGFSEGEIGGNHTLLLRTGALLNSSWLPKIGSLNSRLITLFHAGNAWDHYGDMRLQDLHYGGSASMAWETQFGTILMGAGYTQEGSFRYNLSLGHFF